MARKPATVAPVARLACIPTPPPLLGPDRALLPEGMCWALSWATAIPLAPRGEGRARASVREQGGPKGRGRRAGAWAGLLGASEGRGMGSGAASAGPKVHMYTPDSTRQWQDAATLILRTSWHASGHAKPLSAHAPVRVDVVALFERPERPAHPFFVVVKPDRDNVDKIVLDSLVKAGVLHDDNAVPAGEPLKLYAPEGTLPQVLVWIYELAPASMEAPCP